MTLELLALAALATWSDPGGDTYGAGDLTPPTAAVYSSLAPFDLTEIAWLEGETLTLQVTLAATPNPGDLPLGLTLAVVDLYLDTEQGGRETLLPGPEMRMPPDRAWNIAVRLTGDRAFARLASDGEDTDFPVRVARDGDRLVIHTPFRTPERLRVQALTGVYDPFRPDGWRPLADGPSPWAFSHPGGGPPVVDLLASDDAAQAQAWRSGVLPAGRSGTPGAPWLVMMVLGLGVAITGLVLRQRMGRRIGSASQHEATPVASEPDPPSPDHASPRSGTAGTASTVAGEDDATLEEGDLAPAPEPSPAADTDGADPGGADPDLPDAQERPDAPSQEATPPEAGRVQHPWPEVDDDAWLHGDEDDEPAWTPAPQRPQEDGSGARDADAGESDGTQAAANDRDPERDPADREPHEPDDADPTDPDPTDPDARP